MLAPFFSPEYHTRISIDNNVLDSRMDGPNGRDAVGIIERSDSGNASYVVVFIAWLCSLLSA